MTTDSQNRAQEILSRFSNPDAVAHYTEGPPRFVPGFEGLHRMTGLLLAERAPQDAHVLVLGAGGGLELGALAQAYPGWRFTGVDPSAKMLELAKQVMGPDADRAELVEGYIEDAPESPFDAATCLLTLHFLGSAERERTLREIRRRLKPGAPFVAAHSSFPQGPGEREQWMLRYAAFAVSSGTDPAQAQEMLKQVQANLDLLSPEDDEELMRAAGFTQVQMFYAAFTWRGWVATA